MDDGCRGVEVVVAPTGSAGTGGRRPNRSLNRFGRSGLRAWAFRQVESVRPRRCSIPLCLPCHSLIWACVGMGLNTLCQLILRACRYEEV